MFDDFKSEAENLNDLKQFMKLINFINKYSSEQGQGATNFPSSSNLLNEDSYSPSINLNENLDPTELSSSPDKLIAMIGPSINFTTLLHLTELLERETHELIIFMNCTKGDFFSGLACYNFLKGLPSIKITAINLGIISGPAFLPFLAADHKFCFPFSTFYLTNFIQAGVDIIESSEVKKAYEKTLMEMVLNIFSKNTDISDTKWAQYFESGKILTAREARGANLVDSVNSTIIK